MAKYAVTHEDGRVTNVYAPDEAGAKKQALHQETTRAVIAAKRGTPPGPDTSIPIFVTKLKD